MSDKVSSAGIVHAEWCGHCKDLLPKWKDFEDKSVKGGSYNGIKVNAFEEKENANEIDRAGIKVSSFPMFWSKTTGGEVKYHDDVDRTTEGIKTWLDKIGGGDETSSTTTENEEPAGEEGGAKEGFLSKMFGGKKKRKSNKRKTNKRKTKKTKRKTKKSNKSKRKSRRNRRK